MPHVPVNDAIGWLITKDHLAQGEWPSRAGTCLTIEAYEDSTYIGGAMVYSRADERHPEIIRDPVPFRLYDDDDELYYEGVIKRRWVEGDERLPYSLFMFGANDAGTTRLDVKLGARWETLIA